MITGEAYNYEMRLNITSVTIAGRNIPLEYPKTIYGSMSAIQLHIETDEEGSRNMRGVGVKTDSIVINGTVDIVNDPDGNLGCWNMNVEAHVVKDE